MSLLKTAAPAAAAGIGSLLASEDADAGLLHAASSRAAREFAQRTLGDGKAPELKERYKESVRQAMEDMSGQRNKMTQQRRSPREIKKALETHFAKNVVHPHTTYDIFNRAASEVDGGHNGSIFMNGMDVFYEEALEAMPKDMPNRRLYEETLRGWTNYRQRGGKGRDRLGDRDISGSQSGSKSWDDQGRYISDAAMMPEAIKRAERSFQHRASKRPIVKKKDEFFVDPKTGRKKKKGPVGFSVGAPGMSQGLLDSQIHNRDEAMVEHMGNLGLLADPMYEYGTLLPLKQNIVTGESSLAAPEVLRDIASGILGLGMTPKTGIYRPEDLLNVTI